MNAQDRLRQLIDQQTDRLRASIPLAPEAAVLAVIRAQDALPTHAHASPASDLISGLPLANPGGNLALWLCLEPAAHGQHATGIDVAAWGTRFLEQCVRLAEARMVLAHSETGFMRLAETSDGTIDAWIATKLAPASWREREDIDWWASRLARHHAPELDTLRMRHPVTDPNDTTSESLYDTRAGVYLNMMAYQFGYPAGAVIGGYTVRTWLDILQQLIASALCSRDRGEGPALVSERELVDRVARALDDDPAHIGPALAAFTLDRGNAAWHAAVPGVAAAPLVRVGEVQLVPSLHGLVTEPLLFLVRELRRRDPEGYHNAAHAREITFRNDLYALFQDKRFVTSEGRIRLRHDTGNLRTDIDAAVFDRKTGTLGIFELKSQDPFARSAAALARQRDNMLYANRQVSGVLDWVKRYGADEIARRIDPRLLKTSRVHKVYPFVLGRYLAQFRDGPRPDPRASWSTWPGVLRVLDDHPLDGKDANPIASLHARLSNGTTRTHEVTDHAPRAIDLGDARLVVHPSYAAFQASLHNAPSS